MVTVIDRNEKKSKTFMLHQRLPLEEGRKKNFGEKGINFQSVLAVHSESHLFAKQWQYFKLSST